ncbi:uncharacterized protein LOC124692292 [Lolium rigidum]|uniref:uncharacterized protein LOC124692292 n=1 Tax=Lolium rigidum TaxID=89674 RepID=UPI001F5DD256|nr:uncharacterized protein LOC124692292 [Lolium rigidum]
MSVVPGHTCHSCYATYQGSGDGVQSDAGVGALGGADHLLARLEITAASYGGQLSSSIDAKSEYASPRPMGTGQDACSLSRQQRRHHNSKSWIEVSTSIVGLQRCG